MIDSRARLPCARGRDCYGKGAAIELYALHDVHRGLERPGLDGDDAVLADLVHRLDDAADGPSLFAEIVLTCDHAVPTGLATSNSPMSASTAFSMPRLTSIVCACMTFLAPSVDLREHRGGRAVARDVRGLSQDLRTICAHVQGSFRSIGDRHAVLGNRRRSELLSRTTRCPWD